MLKANSSQTDFTLYRVGELTNGRLVWDGIVVVVKVKARGRKHNEQIKLDIGQ